MTKQDIAKEVKYFATLGLPTYTTDDLLNFADETDKLNDSELISWATVRTRVRRKYGLQN